MFQALKEKEFGKSLIDVKELFLSTEKYFPSESTIMFELTADGWEQCKKAKSTVGNIPL